MILRLGPTVLLCLGAALAQTARKPNVILVSLDQCRADRLHVYGNQRETSPHLDRMAAEGVRFTRFYSAAPWTTPSYASMMTSQYPSKHGATLFHAGDLPGLHPDASPLAELFQKAGYHTGAFVNNGNAGEFLTRRGFDDYDQGQRVVVNITERGAAQSRQSAPATNERVNKWLDQNQSRPFFLFLLYIEPHSPYNPPSQHDLFKSDAYPEETNTGYDRIKGSLFRKANLGDARAIERLTQLYDGKIHFIDYWFGQILDRLRASGLDRNTIVWLTSDHGELLYSHAEDFMTFDHRSLYDQVMHVPGIVWGAEIPRGRVIGAMTTHIDIAPTLLELAGLAGKPDAQGQSLVPLIRGKRRTAHPFVFGEEDVVEPLRSVRDVRYKLILNLRTGAKQLFDDRQDPAERRDIAGTRPDLVKRFSAILEKWRHENEPDPSARDRLWRAYAAKSPPAQIIDEVTIGARMQLSGNGWHMADSQDANDGGFYWTEPAKPGESVRTAMWRPDSPLLGRYRISIWYGSLTEGVVASDVPLIVMTRLGPRNQRLDQTRHRGEWQELGVFEDPVNVSLTNTGHGRVIVDAVKFERLDGDAKAESKAP
jgi:arylsulfatase A-like enzyme